jgi:hypothetical protein
MEGVRNVENQDRPASEWFAQKAHLAREGFTRMRDRLAAERTPKGCQE